MAVWNRRCLRCQRPQTPPVPSTPHGAVMPKMSTQRVHRTHEFHRPRVIPLPTNDAHGGSHTIRHEQFLTMLDGFRLSGGTALGHDLAPLLSSCAGLSIGGLARGIVEGEVVPGEKLGHADGDQLLVGIDDEVGVENAAPGIAADGGDFGWFAGGSDDAEAKAELVAVIGESGGKIADLVGGHLGDGFGAEQALTI